MSKALPALSSARYGATWVRWGVYACFFFSGATSLIFEVLWSRQFVTVFGNSSYAISIVLCAYMTGLGLGGWIGGKWADRTSRWVAAFGAVQVLVGLWALAIPWLLDWLRAVVPKLHFLSTESLLLSTLARFGLSFVILAMPCFLMGTTLPLLVRAVTYSDRIIGRCIGSLYCWNTVGASAGGLAAGFWMLDTLGMRLTNELAFCINMVVALAAFGLSRPMTRLTPANVEAAPSRPTAGIDRNIEPDLSPAWLLLTVAFLNGFVSLACEVLWFRYLSFLEQSPYVFPTVIGIYLLGLGTGGWIYCILAKRIQFSALALSATELLLGLSVLATFWTGALAYAMGPPHAWELRGLSLITVLLPTILMGASFPLLCSVYGRHVQGLGRRVGVLFAVNTAGTVVGSLLPVFVLVPILGIQRSMLLASMLYGAMGLGLLAARPTGMRRMALASALVFGGAAVVFIACAPSNLCQRVFLGKNFSLARHTDILFYREGRTGTAIVTRDRVNQCKTLYVNGASEVPVLYSHLCCFKLLGDLGPMLHPDPKDVLMICFGGGIAAGATTRIPEVQSLTIVDLESGVLEAAALLAEENNGVLRDPKTRVVIDDGRNYLMMARRRWPVIISDSTHPKNSDSWVLYTEQFYKLVRKRLTSNGVFVEWVPRHGLSSLEFRIIVRTFQSVFPHGSLWVAHGIDDQGQFISYGLLVGTAQPLSINVRQLQQRLGVEAVRRDLEPFGLHTVAGLLDSFICAESALRNWAGEGPVNTDDLPYTQYKTCHSRKVLMDSSEFVPAMEPLLPYLTDIGDASAVHSLGNELAIRSKISRLALLGRTAEAYSVLPEDIRFARMRRLLDEGPRYSDALLKTYWDNPQGLIYLASLNGGRKGGVAAMCSTFERVLELEPENVSALNFMAMLQTSKGNYKEAEALLRRALARQPRSSNSHYNLAMLLESTGRHEEAMEHARLAAMDRSNAKAADHWGQCLAMQGRSDEAIHWFEQAIETQPTLVSARVHLASWLQRKGQTKEALDQMRYLSRLDPENEKLMGILTRLQRADQAAHALEATGPAADSN